VGADGLPQEPRPGVQHRDVAQAADGDLPAKAKPRVKRATR
jgi:hypothetical protein